MNKQPYGWQQRVQGNVRWDREKLLEPNLHVYGKDDTKIMVYNMKRFPKRKKWENRLKESLRNTTPEGKTPDT